MPHKKGLTLVEILVVIVIFSIISSVLFMVFKAGLDSWRRTESHLEIYQNARMALDMITRDLRAAMLDSSYLNTSVSPPVPYITFRGFDSASPSGWRTNSIGDEMYFVAALNPTDPTAVFDLCKVGYWLDGNGTPAETRDDVLRRYFRAQTTLPPNYNFSVNETSDKVALYTTQLDFLYYDSTGATSTTWDSTDSSNLQQLGRLPSMVQVTITVREPNPINPLSPKTETFVTNVYIPRSQQ